MYRNDLQISLIYYQTIDIVISHNNHRSINTKMDIENVI